MTMQRTQGHMEVFRSRFGDLSDGIVNEVRLEIGSFPHRCVLSINTQDVEAESGWASVVFTVHGFEIGQDKSRALAHAVALCEGGAITGLVIREAGGPVPYHMQLRGEDSSVSDWPRVSRSDVWRARFSGQNAWLEMFFEAEILVRIEHASYHGPNQ